MKKEQKPQTLTPQNIPPTAPDPGDKFPSDVLDSYTGKPADGSKPIQDADDL